MQFLSIGEISQKEAGQRLMSALAILEHLDVLKDRHSRLVSVLETTVMDDLVLQ